MDSDERDCDKGQEKNEQTASGTEEFHHGLLSYALRRTPQATTHQWDYLDYSTSSVINISTEYLIEMIGKLKPGHKVGVHLSLTCVCCTFSFHPCGQT